MEARLVRLVVVLVSAVWGASFIADILIEDYNPSPYVHFAMMAVVGAATGRYIVMRNGGKDG